MDQRVNDLAEQEKLVVNDRFPDLTGLNADLLNGIELKNKHRSENLLLCLQVYVFRRRFNHVIL